MRHETVRRNPRLGLIACLVAGLPAIAQLPPYYIDDTHLHLVNFFDTVPLPGHGPVVQFDGSTPACEATSGPPPPRSCP